MAVWIIIGIAAVLVAFILWRAFKLGTVRAVISELLLFLPR